MPLFFFDHIDDGHRTKDDTGVEMDLSLVQDAAVTGLCEMARYLLPNGTKREFAIEARESGCAAMLRATLSLRVENLA